MTKLLSLFLVAFFFDQLALSQEARKPLPFLVAAAEQKAHLLVLDAPREMSGFNIFRKGKNDKEFHLLNPEPVLPVLDALEARDILGDDFKWIAQKMNTQDHSLILLRMRSDRGLGTVLTLLSQNAAKVLGRMYVDESAKTGEKYIYRIEYLDFNGRASHTVEQTIQLKDIKLKPPALTAAEPGDRQAKISWKYPPYAGNPADIVVGFRFYRTAGKNDFQKIDEAPILRQEGFTARTDTGLVNGAKYTYVIKSVDFLGRESEPSNTIVVTPRDAAAPHVPTGLSVTPQESKIILNWPMNRDADIDHYDVYRGSSSQGAFDKINPLPILGDKPAFVDSNLVFGPYYFYRIKAVDRSGNESTWSAALPARPNDTTAPSPPENLSQRMDASSVTLRWQRPKDKDLFGYYVYRGFARDKLLRVITKPMLKDTTLYSDSGYQGKGLWPGKVYYYAVSAIDVARNESAKNIIVVKMPDMEAPRPPVDVRARTTPAGLVQVGWQPSSSVDVGSYRIYRGSENKADKTLAEVRGYSYVDSAVVKGQSYIYQVCAVDTFGNESAKTAPMAVVPGSIYMAPPAWGVQAILGKSGVTVTWKKIVDSELLGYNVYRSDQPSGIYQKLNTAIVRSESFADPAGQERHFYKVASVTISGRENNNGRVVAVSVEKSRP